MPTPYLKTNKENKLEELWKKYKLIFYRGKFKYQPKVWILISIGLTIACAVATYFIFDKSLYITLIYTILMAVFFFFGIPYRQMEKRLEKIEYQTPYFLTQLASSLRAGMGIDSGLSEVSRTLGGPLGYEVRRSLAEMKKGISQVEAFQRMGERIGTVFIKRIFRIIATAIEQGGRLADILDEVAQNAENILKIKKEREAATAMVTLFLYSSSIISAAILGVVAALFKLMYLKVIQMGIVSKSALAITPTIFLKILIIYCAIQGFLVCIIAGKMKKGKISSGLIMAPALAYLNGVLVKLVYLTIFAHYAGTFGLGFILLTILW